MEREQTRGGQDEKEKSSGKDGEGARGGRLLCLDRLRGLTLCSMICYHGMWDAVWLYGLPAPWYEGLPGFLWQQSICMSFIFLSGFSYRLGKRHLKRGAEVFLAGGLVSAATLIWMPEARVLFGVLTLIGSCMLLWKLPHEIISRRAEGPGGAAAGMLCSGFLFLACREAARRFPGFGGAGFPEGFCGNLLTAYLGFPPDGFFSSDYFPLFPWIFLFICGYFSNLFLEKSGKMERRRSLPRRDALGFLGRRSLAVYLLHQPLLLLLFEAARALSGFGG